MNEATEADRTASAGHEEPASASMAAEGLDPIELSILIEARPETVYSILSDPEKFADWMGGSAGTHTMQPGSPFELAFPQFETTIAGEVLELVENRKVAVTWGVAVGPQADEVPAGSTRVEFILESEGASTRLTLTHSGIGSLEERAQHEAGWRFHGARLALFANRAFLTIALKGLVTAFFGAWNEPDAEKRLALLAESCVAEVEFTDEYATLQGLDELSLHIGNSQMYMPGLHVEQDGDVTICLGEALIPWRILDAEGNVTHQGIDHARVTPEGKLASVKGFWQ